MDNLLNQNNNDNNELGSKIEITMFECKKAQSLLERK